jgi:hypothetical protein
MDGERRKSKRRLLDGDAGINRRARAARSHGGCARLGWAQAETGAKSKALCPLSKSENQTSGKQHLEMLLRLLGALRVKVGVRV